METALDVHQDGQALPVPQVNVIMMSFVSLMLNSVTNKFLLFIANVYKII